MTAALTPSRRHGKHTAIAVAAIAAAIIGVLCLFYLVDPVTARFFPQCPSRLLTGYDCPGCGTSRALHALVHLRISEAWHYNAALFFAIPLMALYLIGPRTPQDSVLNRLARSGRLAAAVAVAVVLWAIVRNIVAPL